MAAMSVEGYGSRMSQPERSRRQQLIDARSSVQRQIEMLESGPTSADEGCAFIEPEIAISDFKKALREIEDKLAKLGPDDA